jgi:hypothetical protein
MSFLKTLFGIRDRSGQSEAAKAVQEIEYKDFRVRAEPYGVGSQFQTAGTIEKLVDGQVRSKSFIRADLFASADEAAAYSLRKGCQIIDEQGLKLFD